MSVNGVTLGRESTVTIFDPNVTISIQPNEFAGGKIVTQVDKADLVTFGDPIGIYVPRGYIITLDFYRKNDSTTAYWTALMDLYYGRVNINAGTINIAWRDADGVHEYIFSGAICRDMDIGAFGASNEMTGTLEFFAGRMHKFG